MQHELIGYYALAVPGQLWWQGYFLTTSEPLVSIAVKMQEIGANDALMAAMMIEGAIQADEGVIAAAALALSDAKRAPYFLVVGACDEGGTLVHFQEIEAESIDEARAAIRSHPIIADIEMMRVKLAEPPKQPLA